MQRKKKTQNRLFATLQRTPTMPGNFCPKPSPCYNRMVDGLSPYPYWRLAPLTYR
jgi:hypothetical protein